MQSAAFRSPQFHSLMALRPVIPCLIPVSLFAVSFCPTWHRSVKPPASLCLTLLPSTGGTGSVRQSSEVAYLMHTFNSCTIHQNATSPTAFIISTPTRSLIRVLPFFIRKVSCRFCNQHINVYPPSNIHHLTATNRSSPLIDGSLISSLLK